MPVCAVYIGLSCTSILAVKTPKESFRLKFPYSYFDNFGNKDRFLSGLLANFFQENHLVISEFQFAVCGFMDFPDIKREAVVQTNVMELIANKALRACAWEAKALPLPVPVCFITNFGILSQHVNTVYSSISPREHEFHIPPSFGHPTTQARIPEPAQDQIDEADFLSNLSLYPQITSNKIDDALRYSNLDANFSGGRAIFTGDRFFDQNDSISRILAFDLIKKPGIYDITIDFENIWVLSTLMKMLDPDLGEAMPAVNDCSGVLVNAPGGAECLVTSDIGTSQLLEIKDNSIFVLPTEKGHKSKIVVKGSSLTVSEKRINGGDLGLIIDTRPKNNPNKFKEISNQKNLKLWGGAYAHTGS